MRKLRLKLLDINIIEFYNILLIDKSNRIVPVLFDDTVIGDDAAAADRIGRLHLVAVAVFL